VVSALVGEGREVVTVSCFLALFPPSSRIFITFLFLSSCSPSSPARRGRVASGFPLKVATFENDGILLFTMPGLRDRVGVIWMSSGVSRENDEGVSFVNSSTDLSEVSFGKCFFPILYCSVNVERKSRLNKVKLLIKEIE